MSFIKFTIKKQCYALLIITILSSGVLFAVCQHLFGNIVHETTGMFNRKTDIETITNLREKITELTLTAMDIIVDKDEGAVSQDRKTVLKENSAIINELLGKLEKNYTDAEDKASFAKIKQGMPIIEKALNELVTAVETLAESGEFARLDDLIDGTAEEMLNATIHLQKQSAQLFLNSKDTVQSISVDSKEQIITVLTITTLIIIGLSLITIRAMGTPLTSVLDYLKALEQGDIDFDVKYTKRNDEIGVIAQHIAALKHTVGEAFTLQQMIMHAPMNVMTVDVRNDFTITFANEASIKTLNGLRSILNIDTDHIVGHSMDIFHKNPDRIRALVANPANLPHRAIISIANKKMELFVSPIYNKNGEYSFAMLTWKDITEKEIAAHAFERDIKSVVTNVASAANQLSVSAQDLNYTVNQSHTVANNASNASAQTTQNVQSVASAAEQMRASVVEISNQIQKTNALVRESVQQASNADILAGDLKNASMKVSDVVKIISEISGQINLLALNATIESARAGDAGKGFAVVANEVKNLADQVDTSLSTVASVLKEMDSASDNVTQALGTIRQSISEISEATNNVASAIEEQSATTGEIARNMSTAASHTHVVSDSLGQVSSVATQASASSSQMLQATQKLSQDASYLHHQVEDFLNKMRA